MLCVGSASAFRRTRLRNPDLFLGDGGKERNLSKMDPAKHLRAKGPGAVESAMSSDGGKRAGVSGRRTRFHKPEWALPHKGVERSGGRHASKWAPREEEEDPSNSSSYSWNKRLSKAVQAGQYEKTLELFQQMEHDGKRPNKFSFLSVLKACARLGRLADGRRIHGEIIQQGLEGDVFLGCALVDMYAKCGSIEDAEGVFNRMPTRNVVAWTAMIGGYAKCGEGQQALDLFERMEREGICPDPVTFVGVLNACASVTALGEGRRVHAEIIRRGYETNVVVGCCLVDMYAKCGSIEEAEGVFNHMPARDVVAWNSIILGYAKRGDGKQALELYKRMQREGVCPDPVTFVGVLSACACVAALEEGRLAHAEIIRRGYDSNVVVGCCLIDMYAKCGSIEEAEKVFNQMPTQDVMAWNAMIGRYVKRGEGQQALKLFERMQQEGVPPNPVTFVGVLNACGSIEALEEGRHAHAEIIRRGYESVVAVGNSLLDMYTKCGSIDEAESVFRAMPSRDAVGFTTMIQGYVKCGEGQQAMELYEQMQREGFPRTLLPLWGS